MSDLLYNNFDDKLKKEITIDNFDNNKFKYNFSNEFN